MELTGARGCEAVGEIPAAGASRSSDSTGGFGRRGMGNRRIGRGGREKRWGRVNWSRGRGDV